MQLFRPLIAALVGFVLHAVAMAIGYGYDLGYASIAGVGVLTAVLLGAWGAARDDARAGLASLLAAVLAFLSLPGWWAGFPTILGVAAIELALEARLQSDHRSVTSTFGLVGGSVVVVISLVLCLVG